MKVLFTARHFNASQRLQDYAEESVAKLSKYFDHIQDVSIVAEPFEHPDTPQRIEITLHIPGHTLVAGESAESYEMAINKVVDNLKRQLIKHKEKHFTR